MRYTLLISVLFILLFSSDLLSNGTSTNATISNVVVNIPTNPIQEGGSMSISTNFNFSTSTPSLQSLSSTVPRASCYFNFLYSLSGAGVSPTNVSQTQFLVINSSYSGVSSFLATFAAPGLVNASVMVSLINCTPTNYAASSASSSASLITVLAAVAAAPIPTLGQWGVMILGILVMIVAGVAVKKEIISSLKTATNR